MPLTVNTPIFTNRLLPTGGPKTNSWKDGSIGCPMMMEVEISTTQTFENCTIAFNPELFAAVGTLTPFTMASAYLAKLTTLAPGDVFTMPLVGTGANEPAARNLECSIHIDTTAHAFIRLEFVLTMDLNGPITPGPVNNHDRLLKAHKSDPPVVGGGGQSATIVSSVYRNTTRVCRVHLDVTDADAVTTSATVQGAFQSRFYGRGLGNNANGGVNSELGGNLYQTELVRGGQVVDNLSVWAITTARFILAAVTEPVEPINDIGLYCYVIRTDAGPNYAEWLNDYQSSGYLIEPTDITGDVKGGHVIVLHPSIGIELIDGVNRYVAQFDVGTDLDINGHYAAICIVGGFNVGDEDNTFTNSFIIPYLKASDPPPPIEINPLSVTGTIIDYNADPFTDNVISTVVDTVVARVEIDTTYYDIAAVAHPVAVDWATDVRSIALHFIDEDTSEELAVRVAHKVAGVWTCGDPGVNCVVNEVMGPVQRYSFEVHECMENLVGLQNWGGRKIILEWQFFAQYDAAYTVTKYTYRQRLEVRNFRNFGAVIQSIEYFDWETGLPLQTLCGSGCARVRVTLDPLLIGPDTWNLRVLWQLEGYGLDEMQVDPRGVEAIEEEAYASPPGVLIQLDDAFNLFDVPATFDVDGIAEFRFCFDGIGDNEKVRLYVIAEPEQSPTPPCPTWGPIAAFEVHDLGPGFEIELTYIISLLAGTGFGSATYTVNGAGGGSLTPVLGGTETIGPFSYGDAIHIKMNNSERPDCPAYILDLTLDP